MKLRMISPRKARKSYKKGLAYNKHGALTLYPDVIKKMGLKEGDQIAIIQDEEKPKDFYLLRTKSQEYPSLRGKKNTNFLMCGYKTALATICESFRIPVMSINLPVGGAIKTELGQAFCLITSALGKEGNDE